MVIAVTGHRPDKLGGEYFGIGPYSDYVRKKLQEQIDILKPTRGVCGMALGVDTIFAKLILANNIPLTAAIPFKGQEVKWDRRNIKEYEEILAHPLVTVVYICEPGYAGWKMHKRNMWMVDISDKLIGVSDGSKSGTQNCMDYARDKKKKEVIDISLKGLVFI